MDKSLALIGAASGWGAADRRTADGPLALQRYGLEQQLVDHGIAAVWTAMVQPLFSIHSPQAADIVSREMTYPLVCDMNERLAEKTAQATRHGKLPVVIGGDHSLAAGTWSGIAAELHAEESFGLIWLDAHMDAHTPKTANEGKWGGNYHGRPLAWLLGEGEPEMTHLASAKPKLNPKHVVQLGIRSYEPGERKLLEKLGVRVFYMEEINRRGFAACFEEALEIATTGTKGFGLTVDVDGFDPADAPGTGTTEAGGLRAQDVLPAINGLAAHAKFCGLELSEYNPYKDEVYKTADLVGDLLLSLAGVTKEEEAAYRASKA